MIRILEEKEMSEAEKIIQNFVQEFNVNVKSDEDFRGFNIIKFPSKEMKRKFVTQINKACRSVATRGDKVSDSPIYQYFNGQVAKEFGPITPGDTQYYYKFEDNSELTIISFSDKDNFIKFIFSEGPFDRNSFI